MKALLHLLLTLNVAVTTATWAAEPAAVVEATDTLRFRPAAVTIEVGELVQWHNASVLVHTVTADPTKATSPESVTLPPGAASFDSGNLAPGADFVHRFTAPGVYRYFCIPHEGAKMRGIVVVRPAGRPRSNSSRTGSSATQHPRR